MDKTHTSHPTIALQIWHYISQQLEVSRQQTHLQPQFLFQLNLIEAQQQKGTQRPPLSSSTLALAPTKSVTATTYISQTCTGNLAIAQ
mmetsp:Transcript_9760/g.14562  ORF Transcript_9760/g.14562 Transcript_9760/m.14562 type:complete len:88 (-) Transcript_9760:185-448(-)